MTSSSQRSVLFLGPEHGVLRALVSRGDVELTWAQTEAEAHAVLKLDTPDLFVYADAASEGLVATAREVGALALAARDVDTTLTAISNLTGLTFATCPRVPYDELVDVSVAGEQHFLRCADISLTGLSVVDFPSGSIGSAVTVGLVANQPPISLSARIVRLFRLDGRPAAGLVFHGMRDAEAQVVRTLVEARRSAISVPSVPSNAPSRTADLQIDPALLAPETVLAALDGKDVDAPWWAEQVARELTASEREAVRREGPQWARQALEARLCVYGLRAQAGSKNLTTSHFMIVREVCSDLAKHGVGRPEVELIEIATCRAALLRALFGREQSGNDGQQSQDLSADLDGLRVDEALNNDWSHQQKCERTRAAAHALIRTSDIAGAARVYADAGMLDEAIHLYLNVLGAPGLAAPLAARRWGLERAAELYELADQADDAARTWGQLAGRSSRPERFLRRIDALSQDISSDVLRTLVQQRPLSAQTVAVHYHFALDRLKSGDEDAALATLENIQRTVGNYRDVANRIEQLNGSDVGIEIAFDVSSIDISSIDISSVDISSVDIEEVVAVEPWPDTGRTRDMVVATSANSKASLEQADDAAVRRLVQPTDVSHIAKLLDQREALVDVDEPLPPMLNDEAISLTADGPSMDDLIARLQTPHDGETADIWYWVCLVNLRRGAWANAMQILERLERSTPDFRQVRDRIAAIQTWRAWLANRFERLAVEGAGEAPADIRYVIRGELGRGPDAIVFRARDQQLGRDVALKLFTAEARRRLVDERLLTKRLTSAAQAAHPNIGGIYDFGELEGRLYVASELVERDDTGLQRRRRTLVEVLRAADQIAAALETSHERGLVHGAIKPNNVLSGPMGIVKVIDFSPQSALSMSKEALAFLPGEQLRGEPATPASDVFALGAWIYEAVTGETPFVGLDRDRPPVPIEAHPWLDAILRQSMHPAPGSRFASVKEMRSLLRCAHERARGTPSTPFGPVDVLIETPESDNYEEIQLA